MESVTKGDRSTRRGQAKQSKGARVPSTVDPTPYRSIRLDRMQRVSEKNALGPYAYVVLRAAFRSRLRHRYYCCCYTEEDDETRAHQPWRAQVQRTNHIVRAGRGGGPVFSCRFIALHACARATPRMHLDGSIDPLVVKVPCSPAAPKLYSRTVGASPYAYIS
jgi:hypothetical protein